MTTASTLSGSVHVWRFLLTISAKLSLMNQSVKRHRDRDTKRPQVMCLCLQFTCAGNNAAEQDGQHWSTCCSPTFINEALNAPPTTTPVSQIHFLFGVLHQDVGKLHLNIQPQTLHAPADAPTHTCRRQFCYWSGSISSVFSKVSVNEVITESALTPPPFLSCCDSSFILKVFGWSTKEEINTNKNTDDNNNNNNNDDQ